MTSDTESVDVKAKAELDKLCNSLSYFVRALTEPHLCEEERRMELRSFINSIRAPQGFARLAKVTIGMPSFDTLPADWNGPDIASVEGVKMLKELSGEATHDQPYKPLAEVVTLLDYVLAGDGPFGEHDQEGIGKRAQTLLATLALAKKMDPEPAWCRE